MSRRSELLWITALLLLAVAVRFYELGRLPAGFSDEEIDSLRISETVRSGQFGVFYNVQKGPNAGREGLFPALETLATGLIGEGLWSYRIVPSLAGLLGVALTYAAARRLVNKFGAFIAALSMAIGLWPVLLSRLALPQTLMVPIGAAALWLLARAAYIRRDGVDPLQPRTRTYTALGVMLALAAYTHWSGLLIWPLALVFALFLWRTRQPISRRAANYAGFALLVALILGIPYLTTTLRLPGLSGPATFWYQRPVDVNALLTHTRDLLVSLLGGDGGALIILLPIAIVLATGIGVMARRGRQPGAGLLLLALVFGAVPAIWTGRGDFNLALAFPAAAILIGAGATAIVESIQAVPTRRVVSLAAVFSGATLLVGLNSQLFARWPDDPAIVQQYHTDLGHVALYLDMARDKMPTLVCTPNLFGDTEQPLSTPKLIQMMIHREVNIRFSDCRTAVVLANGGRNERVIFDASQNGIKPSIPLALQPWLPPDGTFSSVPGTQHLALATLNVEQPLADAIGKLILSPATWSPGQAGTLDPVTLPVQMGDYLHFEGYSLDTNREYKPGDFIHLITYWRIDGPQRSDVRVFAHVLADPDTAPVIQNDTLDTLPGYLTDRDIVIQSQLMQIPYPFPAGDYFLSVGAYHATDQSRVPVYDANGQVRGDRLFLGTLHIKG
ncbi:MAG: ArnT family glycosyltransferase [Aggregatilineales bacterium]